MTPYTVHTKGGVLITGASTGIGRDAAVALASNQKGFVVYAGVRNGKGEGKEERRKGWVGVKRIIFL